MRKGINIILAGILVTNLVGCGGNTSENHETKQEEPKIEILTPAEQTELAKLDNDMVTFNKKAIHEQELKELKEKVEKEKAEQKAKEEAEAKAKEEAKKASDPANMGAVAKAQWENANFADVHERANYLVAHPNHLNNIVSDADTKAYLETLNDMLQSSGEMQLEWMLSDDYEEPQIEEPEYTEPEYEEPEMHEPEDDYYEDVYICPDCGSECCVCDLYLCPECGEENCICDVLYPELFQCPDCGEEYCICE